MINKKFTTKDIVVCGMIAAVYCVITLVFAPFSYGLMQVRISEALAILPVFSPVAPMGLFIGCLIANIVGGGSIFDIIFGSLTTLFAGILTAKLKNRKWLAPLPPVVLNAAAIGAILFYIYDVGAPLLLCMLYVGAGQAISCYCLGMPLYFLLSRKKTSKKLFP